MISAKSVRSSYDTEFQAVSQGNTCNPRSAQKLHNRTRENNRAGGTNNLIRAMFAEEDPRKPRKMCKVVTRELDTHDYDTRTGRSTRTNVKPDVTHTVVVTPDVIPLETLLARAERRDMTLVEYCNFIGYTM